MENETTRHPKPFDLLGSAIGKEVVVRTKSGTEIRGKLTAFDNHMNLVLEDVGSSVSFGKQLLGVDVKETIRADRLLLRGGVILFIAPVSAKGKE